MLLVSGEGVDGELVDACMHCGELIRVGVVGGRVANVTPPEAVLFRGGG